MLQIQNLQKVHQFEFWCLSNFPILVFVANSKQCFQCLSSIEIALSAPVSRSNGLLLGKKKEPFSIQLQSFQTTGKQQAMLFWLKTTLLALRANLGFYRSVDVLSARVSRIAPLLLINLGAYIHTVTKKYILALNQSFI